jgi:hypothetical protein
MSPGTPGRANYVDTGSLRIPLMRLAIFMSRRNQPS